MIIIETCPKCGGDLRDEVICTYPPIPRKVCSNCSWSWEGEQEKIVRVPSSSSFPDKKCSKKAPERGQRIKCGPVDDAANELGGLIMNHWIDEQTGCKMCEPDCADEWLFDIWAIGFDYDGASTVEDFKSLVKEIVYCSQKARDCLWEGKLFGVHGAPIKEDKEEETKIDKDIVRDCHKCVYEAGCHGNPVGCKSYKRGASDGGYYG